MCGFAGFINRKNQESPEALKATVTRMAESLEHRGPDDAGSWVDPNSGIAMGFRRLSIMDLSANGHQPMQSGDGRYILSFNGEVYNFLEIRKELEKKGRRFHSHSDSEVVLEACSAWGIPGATKRFIGMFAFAIWDRKDCTLHLVRDRLGVKPLYWGEFGNLIIFGSELKALRAHHGWVPEIDRSASVAYLRHAYYPAPYTVYKGIQKLLPGHILTFTPDDREAKSQPYWSLAEIAAKGIAEPLRIDEVEAEQEFYRLLRDATSHRMIADVPVGAFLSGGLDSTAVVAMMQEIGNAPVHTFTIGFDDPAYNEANYAKEVAHHLGTDHTEHYLAPNEAIDLIPHLPTWYDEPFADSSQIPTALVSRLARENVTVALTGDGGDELLGGYPRYFAGESIWQMMKRIPKPLRQTIAKILRVIPVRAWDRLLCLLPNSVRPNSGGQGLHWYAGILSVSDWEDVYRQQVSYWHEPNLAIPSTYEERGAFWGSTPDNALDHFMDQMQFLDTLTYLPDDILVKVDRASMAFGLEARGPFLDHRLVEFSWRLPRHFKTKDGVGKILLRQLVDRYVPSELMDRPKLGFGVPIPHWLRGPLRDWGETLLSEKNLRESCVFDPAAVRLLWNSHINEEQDHSPQLWPVLMFLAWQEKWMG